MNFRYLYSLVVVVIVAMGIAAPSMAADTSAPWQGIQEQDKVVRGSFVQKKYLAELDQPLVSSGHYVVAAGHGLIWQVDKPVDAQLVITKKHLTRRSNGHEIARVSVEQQPALSVVAAVLLAVFQADSDQLEQYFKVQTKTRGDDHWSMTLRPVSKAVSQFIKRVHIEGAKHIERIELYKSGGDHTLIKLHTASQGAPELSAKERAEFQQ